MALIKCTECGHMISDKAVKCPKCGCPTKVEMVRHQEDVARDKPVYYEEESHTNKWLYVVIALLMVAIAGIGYYFYGSNNNKTLKENPKKLFTDSSTVVNDTIIEESPLIEKDSDIKVEGYNVIGKSEDLSLRLCANVNDQLVTTNIGDGQVIVEVLDEHDYDGDGRNECLLFTSMGGAAPYGYRVVYYNLATGKIEDVWLDCYEEPTLVNQNGKWHFSVKEGINTQIFVFDKGKIRKLSDKNKKTSKALTTYIFHNVFGMEELDEQEKIVLKNFDIDGDGSMETLEFNSNQSHLYDWGKAMDLIIHWHDNRQAEIGMTANKIAILSSKSNGLYDLLLNDKYLFKWNGREYVEME